MRLTLRTLLAYLDGVLEPKDHEEIAKQIETSENAKELIHRTGDTVRRIRLGAPPIDSPTHDANAVAEYLDGAMSPQDVVEFERRCLESDPELAEAASCHHILKMVLAERAEVDDDLRRVMYALPSQHAAAQRAEPVVERPGVPSASAAPAAVEVPDYLRPSRKPLFWRLAPAVAAVLLLGAAAWVFAPGGLYDQARRDIADADVSEADRSAEPNDGAQEAGALETEASGAETQPGSGAADEGDQGDGGQSDSSEATPSGQTTPTADPQTDADAEPAVAGAEPPVDQADLKRDSSDLPVQDAANQDAANADGGAGQAIDETSDAGDQAAIDRPADLSRTGDATAEPIGPASTDDFGGAAAPGDADVDAAGLGAAAAGDPALPPAEPIEVGMVSSPGEVLLRYDAASESWRRLAFGEAGALPSVVAGDRLLSLPYYRPVIAIKGLNVNLSGATLVEVDQGDTGQGSVLFRLIYGRLVLQNTGGDASSIELNTGGSSGVATLQRGSVLAIEADRPFQAGRDPSKDPSPLVVSYYAPAGGVEWQGDSVQKSLASGGAWREVDGLAGPVEPFSGSVDWLIAEPLTNLQRQAAAEMGQTLISGEPIWTQLEALKDARRIEQQSLAAIASLHVGRFRPSIRALSDGEQRSAWPQEIEALRSIMSSSPELALAVRDALADERGERYADDLYRLLCGFTTDEVGRTREERRIGVMSQLIDWLESDQLDYRVLANHNLEQITGRRGVFNPVGFLRSREATVSRFRNRLEDGDLVNRAER